MSSQTTTRRARDRISSHPYKHAAAAIASAHRTDDPSSDDGGGDERNISSSIPSLFGVAGVVGGPEFDPYQKYRHDIFPCKEHLAHEVNKLVLGKKNLDALLRKRAVAARNLHDESTDDESSYGDGSETTDMLLEDDDNDDEGMLSSSSTLVDDEDEDIDELL